MAIQIVINNNVCVLSGNTKVLKKLYKALRFRHPNAFHIQKATRYRWDGFVNPLTDKGVIKTGLLPQCVEFLTEYEDEYDIVDHRVIPEIIGVPDEIGGLKLTGSRAYQKEAAEAVVYNEVLGIPFPRGLGIQSMNAGKTLIMSAIHLSYRDARTMILLNNAVLYDQFRGDLEKLFPDDFGYMRGKKVKWGKIMVVMAMTLQNRLVEYREELKEFNILLTDEADLANNKTFITVYKALNHITVRGGFTGTAFMRDLAKDRLKNLGMKEIFGEVVHEVTMKELEDKDISTPVVIKIIRGNLRVIPKSSYKEEFDELITFNKRRHKVIWKRVRYNLRAGRKNIIVFCKFIEQTEILYKYLAKRVPEGVVIDYTHHRRKDKSILEAFRLGDIHVLVCSLYLKRGMNFPLIKVIVNNAGGEGYSTPLQIMGRGTRSDESKEVFYFEDIFDEGVYLKRHSKRRLAYYKARKVEVQDLR